VAHLRRMASDRSSVAVAAREYCDDVFVGLERSLAARADGTLHSGNTIDVRFDAFMADPFVTIGAIYDQLGVPFGADAERRMRDFLATHPGDGGGGGTRYAWADTGLDQHQVRARAREYQDYFDVPSEPLT
jgi:hypothetical protein